MKLIPSLCFCLLAMTSCFQEVDLSRYAPEPRLVLNASITPGEAVSADVSRTWFIPQGKPNLNIEGAEVELFVNGKWKETMAYAARPDSDALRSRYVSRYLPQAGDEVRVEVRKEGFRPASASDVVPAPPRVDSLSVEYGELVEACDSFFYKYGHYAACRLTFTDLPGVENYYALSLVGRDSLGVASFRRITEADCSDSVLDQYSQSWVDKIFDTGGFYYNAYPVCARTFNDLAIDGQSHTLVIYVPNAFDYPARADGSLSGSYALRLYALSKPLYLFLKSLSEIDSDTLLADLANSGLTDPVSVYSNVRGGVGLLGSYQYIDLPLTSPRR